LTFICIFRKNGLEKVFLLKLLQRLISFMDDSGIDVGVLLPIAPYVPNEYIYRVVAYEPKRLIG